MTYSCVSCSGSRVLQRFILPLALGMVGGSSAFAQSPLPAGTTSGIPIPIVVAGAPPFGGTLLQSVVSPLFGTNSVNTISGTVTSAAFRNTSGFLDFVYQFSFDSATNINVNAISLSSFTDVPGVAIAQTSEDVDGTGLPAEDLGGTSQDNFTTASPNGSYSSASRANASGDGINATMLTGVTGGQTAFTLIVRTEVTGFSLAGSASVQGGGISAFTASQGAIAPVGIGGATAPEPSALTLLSLGIVVGTGMGGAMRKRMKA